MSVFVILLSLFLTSVQVSAFGSLGYSCNGFGKDPVDPLARSQKDLVEGLRQSSSAKEDLAVGEKYLNDVVNSMKQMDARELDLLLRNFVNSEIGKKGVLPGLGGRPNNLRIEPAYPVKSLDDLLNLAARSMNGAEYNHLSQIGGSSQAYMVKPFTDAMDYAGTETRIDLSVLEQKLKDPNVDLQFRGALAIEELKRRLYNFEWPPELFTDPTSRGLYERARAREQEKPGTLKDRHQMKSWENPLSPQVPYNSFVREMF